LTIHPNRKAMKNPHMRIIPLQSGSNGNCVYVEAGGKSLLFDAGISGLQAQRRLSALGCDIRQVEGLFISHDHADHVRCAGVYHRKFGLPLYVGRQTLSAARSRFTLGELKKSIFFEPGQTIHVGEVRIHTVPTPHDAPGTVAFIIDDGRRRVGIFTDLGHSFDGLDQLLAGCDAALLESNYDPQMLRDGPYPDWLKRRVAGPAGHLSNIEAALLLRSSGKIGRLRWACLGHMSENNNTPQLALKTHRDIIGQKFRLHLASRYEAAGPMVV